MYSVAVVISTEIDLRKEKTPTKFQTQTLKMEGEYKR